MAGSGQVNARLPCHYPTGAERACLAGVAIVLASLGLDMRVDRVRDRLVRAARLMLVDQRRALAVVTHPRHQVSQVRAAGRGELVSCVPEIKEVLASRVFDGAGRDRVVGQWLQVAVSDTAMGDGVSPCFFGGGARRAATLVAVRPLVTATLIVQTRPRLGLRGRPAVWRSTASARWLARGRRGRSTSW